VEELLTNNVDKTWCIIHWPWKLKDNQTYSSEKWAYARRKWEKELNVSMKTLNTIPQVQP